MRCVSCRKAITSWSGVSTKSSVVFSSMALKIAFSPQRSGTRHRRPVAVSSRPACSRPPVALRTAAFPKGLRAFGGGPPNGFNVVIGGLCFATDPLRRCPAGGGGPRRTDHPPWRIAAAPGRAPNGSSAGISPGRPILGLTVAIKAGTTMSPMANNNTLRNMALSSVRSDKGSQCRRPQCSGPQAENAATRELPVL